MLLSVTREQCITLGSSSSNYLIIQEQCPCIPLQRLAVLNLPLYSDIVKHVTNGCSKNRGFIGEEKGNSAGVCSRRRLGESRWLWLRGDRGDPHCPAGCGPLSSRERCKNSFQFGSTSLIIYGRVLTLQSPRRQLSKFRVFSGAKAEGPGS